MIRLLLPSKRKSPGRCHALLLLALASCALASAHAQNTNDGFTAQQKPGIALVKPQPWSSAGSAMVTEFKGFTDRTVANAPGAGYYEFDDGAGNKNQVSAARIVVIFIYPDISDIRDIVNSEDRQKVQTSSDTITNLESRYPATRAYIGKYGKQLASALQQYDAGQVEVDGQWMPRETYARQKAGSLAGLLSDDIQRANPVSSFDLENDSRYLKLQQLADGQPDLQPKVKQVADLYQKQVRKEKRAQILLQLANPVTTRQQADVIVEDLRKLQPEEDPASQAYLRSWDASLLRSVDVDKQLLAARTAFEAAVTSVTPPTPRPLLPAVVITQADEASRAASVYKASNPPLQVPVNYLLGTGLGVAADGFSSLASQFVLKQFYDAKGTVDVISPVAGNVGPNTSAAVLAIQDYVARQIVQFKSLRDEARLLIKSKKPDEAYEKFQQAYGIIQDPSLKQEMEMVKGSMPQNSP